MNTTNFPRARWTPATSLIIGCGCVIALLAFGPRSAMGFFQLPMLEANGWSRATFGLAMAIQNLAWGIGQPIFGALADRFGAWRMLALGGLLYASGLAIMASATSTGALYIGGGVLVGLGTAAGSFGIILSVFARNVAPEQRSWVFGLGTASGSAGMFLFAPLSVAGIEALGWSDTLMVMSALMLLVPLLAIPLFGNSKTAAFSETSVEQTLGAAVKEALGHQSYLLLTAGFFVCGFQVAFITAHFPAYIGDIGIDAIYAGWAIALIGFFNIFGSLASGVLGQRYSKPLILALLYIGRSIAVTAFLLLPQNPTSVIVFAIVMGLLWLSTVAPTNALVAIMFGTRHLGMLSGLVFLSHQVGSFLGVWMGGVLYEVYGTYDVVWWLGVALGLAAAAVHWPIREVSVARPAPV